MTRKNPGARPPGNLVRKFNPGMLQSDQEVVDQFVVRNRELDTVLEILHGNIESPSCQHVLIVAPRGRGKTMLLARAAAELRTKDKFSRFLLPVRFMEESHEIFDVADFWLETLFHLARESAASHPELAQELRETHADLSGRWRERTLGDHARAVVLNAAERIDRKLVLMVENLQTLCGSVDDDFGWQLRAALQSEPQIMMLASATSRFEGLEDAEEPFFELFRVIDLTPLTTEECRRLWQTVSGDQVSARDIRPLEILTGGNPRLLVVAAGFAEHRSLRALMEELVRLIDEHTEYFRGHLEALPKSERRVYIAIMDLWQPSSTGEIAERARMDVRVVSTMLGRLVDRGVVMPDRSIGTKKRLYSAAEPLYTIYYKLRRERDEAAVVESLIRFMVAFYDTSVLYPVFDRLWSEVKDSPSLLNGIDRALTKRPVETDLGSRMIWDLLQGVSEDELIGVVGDTGEGDTGPHVVPLALAFKSMSLVEIGRMEEAEKTCEELEEKLGKLQGELKAGVESQTMCVRAIAMMAGGETAAAMGAFRSGYALFPATHRVPVGCMVRLAINFIAVGASERELAEILSRDRTKARVLGPLILALRQRAGEAVRAPFGSDGGGGGYSQADNHTPIEDKAVKRILRFARTP